MRYLDTKQAVKFYDVTENTIRKYQCFSGRTWKIRTRRQNGEEFYAAPDTRSEIGACFEGDLKGKVKTHLNRYFDAKPATSPPQHTSTCVEDLPYAESVNVLASGSMVQTTINFREPAPKRATNSPHTSAEMTARSFFKDLRGDDGEMITEMRTTDGYINATKMCQSSKKPGKTWSDYIRIGTTTEYIAELERCLGIHRDLLITKISRGPNQNRGTYVHPRIATHLAQWISATFAVKVSEFVNGQSSSITTFSSGHTVEETESLLPVELPIPCADSTAQSFFHALRGDDGQMITEMRATDGYINATKMCRSGGKRWNDYATLRGTVEFFSTLERSTKISVDLLITTISGGPNQNRGTYVHPRIATHLAQWISAVFAVKVSELVDRYVRGDITTEESRAAAEIVASSSSNVVNVRPKPVYELQSAGFRNPDDLLRPHVYLGVAGPGLIVIGEAAGQHLISGATNEDPPPAYCDIVRMGITGNSDANPQRKRSHDASFGGNFKLLDWIGCHQPGVIETKGFNFLTQHNRRIVSKTSKNDTNDKSCFRPMNQEEYNHFAALLFGWGVSHDNSLTDNNLLMEIERTEQEREKTAQEKEKTAQLDRKIRLKELELRIRTGQVSELHSAEHLLDPTDDCGNDVSMGYSSSDDDTPVSFEQSVEDDSTTSPDPEYWEESLLSEDETDAFAQWWETRTEHHAKTHTISSDLLDDWNGTSGVTNLKEFNKKLRDMGIIVKKSVRTPNGIATGVKNRVLKLEDGN